MTPGAGGVSRCQVGDRLGEPAAGGRHVATGQGDESLGPGHPRHQGPRLVAAAHRLERGAAQLARPPRRDGPRRRGPRPERAGCGPADGRIAVERRRQQPGRLAVAAGGERDEPGVALGQGDEPRGVEALGQRQLVVGGGERLVEPADPREQMRASREAGRA